MWRSEGVVAEELTAEQALRIEPQLSPHLQRVCRLPEMAQVRNPRHLKALLTGCAARNVQLIPGCSVVGFTSARERVVSVRTSNGEMSAGEYCVAGGAWSGQLLAEAGCTLDIEPVRGQIVQLSATPLPFQHVIECGPRYLVPRPDGRILVGSTEEWVGFEKRNTAAGISGLIEFATELVPSLAQAKFERAWAGLRPGTRSGHPWLSPVPQINNLFVAAGHFRSGLQLSPGSAILMSQMILRHEPAMETDAFACAACPTPSASRTSC